MVWATDLRGATASLIASTPLHDAQGRPLGSLHGLLRREDAALQLRADLLDGGGSVYLVTDNGVVISSDGSAPEETVQPPLHEWLQRGDDRGAQFSWSADAGWVALSSHFSLPRV